MPEAFRTKEIRMGAKKMKFFFFRSMTLLFLVFFAPIFVQASADTEKNHEMEMTQVKQEMTEALNAIQNYTIDKKEEVLAKAQKILGQMDTKIEELEKSSNEKWQQTSEAGREKSQQALRELRKKRNELAEWYGGMKHSSASAWEEVKKGFIDSYQSLQEAFEKASQKF
jgi:hypothetical protein